MFSPPPSTILRIPGDPDFVKIYESHSPQDQPRPNVDSSLLGEYKNQQYDFKVHKFYNKRHIMPFGKMFPANWDGHYI